MTIGAIVRVLCAAGLRALLGGAIFVSAMLAVTATVVELWVDLWGRPRWYWNYHIVPTLIVAGLLAVGFASMRLVEPLAQRIRPGQSYPRKLLAGLAVGLGVFVLTVAFLAESYYALGMIEKGSVKGGLDRIAKGDWWDSWTSSFYAYRLTRPKPDHLLGLALPFALAGFARARKLPLGEQLAISLVFMAFWFGTTFVYWTTYGDQLELASWVVFWLEGASIPLLARWGDRLEARLLPEPPAEDGPADVSSSPPARN